jgi:hypothetical protein
MPRLTQKVPSYRKHASGQAIVVINYKTHYLGKFGSKASRMLYDRLIAEWLASDRRPTPQIEAEITIAEVIAAYWKHCKRHYLTPTGKPSSTQQNIKYLLKPLRKLYGDVGVGQFGPLAFKAAIRQFVEGRSRRTGNMFIVTANSDIHGRVYYVKAYNKERSTLATVETDDPSEIVIPIPASGW